MKTLHVLAAVAALFVGTLSARGELAEVFRAGAWTVSAGTGESGAPMCTMNTHWSDGRYLGVKYIGGKHDGLVLHIQKDSWRIPDGVTVDVAFEFDNMGPWTFTRAGAFGNPRNFVELLVKPESTELFLREFQTARRMRIGWSGNEPDWFVNMHGSSANGLKFRECVITVRRIDSSTQPFSSSRSSQPFNAPRTTQPF